MGYLTYYNLMVYEANGFPKNKELDFDTAQNIFKLSREATSREVDLVMLEENIKWHDHDNDMLEISKEMDDYVFVLYGEGEESDDNWKNVYYNGKGIGVEQQTYYPAISLSELGLDDPDDYKPPEPTPISEYFWNK